MADFHSIGGIRRIEKVKKEDVRRIYGVRKSLERHIHESRLEWYGYVKGIVDDRLVKKIYSSTIWQMIGTSRKFKVVQ